MDYRVIIASFWAVFFAELADKTQLVGVTMAASSGKPSSVWIGSVAAYMIITGVSVALGMLLGRYIKPETVRIAGGIVFILIGALLLTGRV